MPPIPPPTIPRIVVYHQTHHSPAGAPVSILPLVTTPNTHITHLILAAIHLNDPPGHIHLNDHPPSHTRNATLWAEVSVLQAAGVKVLGMLGGAAKGSFTRLDQDDATFEQYYLPLAALIRERKLEGLDLDVEEFMSLGGIVRLIDRLSVDFGPEFLITLAPVAPALCSDYPGHNLSGFSYEALEVMRGSKISWYNTQFYCGWGDLSNTTGFDNIIMRGFSASKVVIGLVTNPGNGSGFVPFEVLHRTIKTIKERYPEFGGVMGWEYFNSLPGDIHRPWEWAGIMTKHVRNLSLPPSGPSGSNPFAMLTAQVPDAVPGNTVASKTVLESVDADLPDATDTPREFEYFSDGSEEF